MPTPTLIFDSGTSELVPRGSDVLQKASLPANASIHDYEPPVPPILTLSSPGACTLSYDAGNPRVTCLDVGSAVATLTYCDVSPDRTPTAPSKRRCEHKRQTEEHLVSEVLNIIQSSTPDSEPIWGRNWEAAFENRWFATQQIAIANNLLQCQWKTDWIEEMVEASILHLGLELEKHPTLGLECDDLPQCFGRWVCQIIREASLAWLRAELRKKARFVYANDNEFVSPPPPLSLSDRLDVNSAIEKLPHVYQNVIWLNLERVSRKNIAKRLGLSIHQVGRIITAARSKLRRALREFEGD